MFTGIYCLPIPSAPRDLHRMLQAAKMASLWRHLPAREILVQTALLNFQNLSPGQSYFLIEELGVPSDLKMLTPSLLYDLAFGAWNYRIYHLQLATAHMLTMCAGHFSDAERKRFIELAESWLGNEPLFNTIIIDILKAFGALDDAFTDVQALDQFKKVLSMDATQKGMEAACTIYTHVYDHPYDTAYAGAYFSLREEDRTLLVERAVQTQATNSMFYAFLLADVVKSPTARMVPALQRVAFKPLSDTMSVQEAISTFIGGISALAMLQAPLPSLGEPANDLDVAWAHAAKILYSLYTAGYERQTYEKQTEVDSNALYKLNAIDVPMRLIRDRFRDDDEDTKRFLDWSSNYIVHLARNALRSARDPISLFGKLHRPADLRHEHMQFAIDIIGLYGNRSDLSKLSALIDDPLLGTCAISAARIIEGR